MPWLSVRYCVRQDAATFLELWAFVVLLAGASVAAFAASSRNAEHPRYPFALRFCAGTLLLFTVLTGILGVSILYGCLWTAASLQGMGTNLPSRTYALLSCLYQAGTDMAHAWMLAVVFFTCAIALLVVGIFRRNAAVRVVSFLGSPLLLILALASMGGLIFAFSWCTSRRLF